ncbi:MAG: argininosuccinate lyase, partial [Oscillospiraceae bacterium]|nr:argininosuccinate lyase [Oscillospiraceae bacterium]
MSKLWSSGFSEDTDALVDEFNASISFDSRMYKEDIAGSKAHAAMLAARGIIPARDAELIISALTEIQEDIESGSFEFRQSDEDIHMAIEAELTRRIGEAGKRLHTARSRNDQVALDFRLYLKHEISEIRGGLIKLLETLCGMAEQNLDAVMPAYTHMQRAQPSTLAHYLMAYANMLRRDVTRLDDCRRRM